MDLALTPQLRDFRDEVRTWLAEHLVGEFAQHCGVGFSWDDAAFDVRLAWDKELAAGGWLCIGWPEQYGGSDAGVDEQLIFQLEYARADARTGRVCRDKICWGRRCWRSATTTTNAGSCRRSPPPRSCGRRPSASPAPARIWRACAPRPFATATNG